MPFITIELFEGRSQDQKDQIAEEVCEVVSRISGAPKEAVHIIIKDLPEGTYYPQGIMKTRPRP